MSKSWCLDNGLIRAYPWCVDGSPYLRVESYSGGAWRSPTLLQISPGQAGGPWPVLRVDENRLHVVTISLVVGNFGHAHLTLRRGDRWLLGHLTQRGASDIEVSVGFDAVSTTALAGDAMRATDDDAFGNRWVLASCAGTLNPDDSAPFSLPTAQALASDSLDFGFAHEIGGSGSTGIDTAEDLEQQYVGWVDEPVFLRGI